MSGRLPLSGLGLPTGNRARLRRIRHGLGNGTALLLPYDQSPEHGLRDFFTNPVAAAPAYIVRRAFEGGFNGVAMQVGNAEKFYDQESSTRRAVDRVVAFVGCGLVVFPGGTKTDDEPVLTRTREAMDAGASGVIYGRNIWQRGHVESLRCVERLDGVLTRDRSVPKASS